MRPIDRAVVFSYTTYPGAAFPVAVGGPAPWWVLWGS